MSLELLINMLPSYATRQNPDSPPLSPLWGASGKKGQKGDLFCLGKGPASLIASPEVSVLVSRDSTIPFYSLRP